MFVVTLTYIADLAEVDAAMADHIAWLGTHYASGAFVASGRRVPRVGGVILADGLSREDLDKALAEDPFQQRGLADYSVVEFTPTTVAPGLEQLLA